MTWIKRIFRKRTKTCTIQNITPRYESVIIDKGDGEWYHPTEYGNPLHHQWIRNGNTATCRVCRQKVERRIINEG